jgi:dUTPase
VIDRDFDGNVGVLMFNQHPTKSVTIHRGDIMVQLICEKCVIPDLQELSFPPRPKRVGSFGMEKGSDREDEEKPDASEPQL